MSTFSYLFATLSILSLILSPSVFAQNDFLPLTADDLAVEPGEFQGETETEGNWENEECYWEENEFDLEQDLTVPVEDPGQTGKAADGTAGTDISNIAGNTPEEIGAAVAVNIDKQLGVSNEDGTNSAIADDVGAMVTNAINAVNADPNNINAAIGGAVADGFSDWGSRAEELAAPLVSTIIPPLSPEQQQQLQAIPPEQANAITDSVNQAQTAMINSAIASIGDNAQSVGTAVGNAIGDAITQSDNSADAAGNAVANIDQAVADNADNVVSYMSNVTANALAGNPNLPPEQIPQIQASVVQYSQDFIANSLPAGIEQDRANWTQAVSNAINTVQNSGDPANQNVVAVINAAGDELAANNAIV